MSASTLRCQLPAPHHEKSALSRRRRKMTPHDSPIPERKRKEGRKAKEEHTAARPHRSIKGRGGIHQQCAHHCRAGQRQQMLGRIGQIQHVRVPAVSSDDKKRDNDNGQLEEADERGTGAAKCRTHPRERRRSVRRFPSRRAHRAPPAQGRSPTPVPELAASARTAASGFRCPALWGRMPSPPFWVVRNSAWAARALSALTI